MRKIYLLLTTFSVVTLSAQKANFKIQRNEIKINALYSIWGATEISYERLLNEKSSIGVSVFREFNGRDGSSFFVSPYYRYYFGKKFNQGVFIESQSLFSTPQNNFLNIENKNGDVLFGAGIGAGYKFITKKNVILEANASFGKAFGTNDMTLMPNYFRLGLNIGKRF